jgi:hypothetical protein
MLPRMYPSSAKSAYLVSLLDAGLDAVGDASELVLLLGLGAQLRHVPHPTLHHNRTYREQEARIRHGARPQSTAFVQHASYLHELYMEPIA